MNATRVLLNSLSPIDLTAVSIAKQAKTSSATFYMYFDDVRDVMFALSQDVSADMVEVHEVLDQAWDPAKIELGLARRLVERFDAIWERHRAILRYRNLEADRGDKRFDELRVQYYMPIIERIADKIIAAYPLGEGPRKGDAFAEAAALYAALEGIASTDPKVVEHGLGLKRLQEARARIIAHALGGRGPGDNWYPKKSRSKAKAQEPSDGGAD